MLDRTSKKRPRDINQLAAVIVDEATREDEQVIQPDPQPGNPKKNPAAVELGRLGGMRGGKARAAKLSPEQRPEIAKKAAEKRWRRANEGRS